LRPLARPLCLFLCEVQAILLQMYLHDERDSAKIDHSVSGNVLVISPFMPFILPSTNPLTCVHPQSSNRRQKKKTYASKLP
jgi:hypothetical protein